MTAGHDGRMGLNKQAKGIHPPGVTSKFGDTFMGAENDTLCLYPSNNNDTLAAV